MEAEQLEHLILMEIAVILEFKVLEEVEVVRLLVLVLSQIKDLVATVVPVSSSSLTLHKTPLLVV